MRFQRIRAVSAASAVLSAAILLQAAMSVQAEKIPENDPYYTGTMTEQPASATSRMVLPSAGIHYALSAQKVSLQDVETRLVEEGKIVIRQQETKKGIFGRKNAAKTSVDTAASPAGADQYGEMVSDVETVVNDDAQQSRIQTTLLTPVQMREKTIVDEMQTQGVTDISSATVAMSTAVQVVVDTRAIEADAALRNAGIAVTSISTDSAEAVNITTDYDAAAAASVLIAGNIADSDVDAASADAGAITGWETITEDMITAADYVPVQDESYEVNEAAEANADETSDEQALSASVSNGEQNADAAEADGSESYEDADESEDTENDDAENGSTEEVLITEDDFIREDQWMPESENASHKKAELVQFNLLNGQDEDAADDAQNADSESDASSDSDEGVENSEEGNEEETSLEDAPLMAAYVDDFLYIRSEPSADAEVVGKLYSKSIGRILEDTDENGWMKIQSGEVTGYVLAKYTATADLAEQIFEEVRQRHASINATSLRVHVVPEMDSDVITLIWQGMEYDVLEELDGWYKVNTVDGIGYISADYTDYEEIIPEAISRQQEEAELARQRAEEEARRAAAAAQAASSSKSSSTPTWQGQTVYVTAEGSAKGQEVANFALQFLGNPYVWGGTSLTNGADCSGFTMSVYAHFGVSLPHYDASQRQCGTAVPSLSQAVPGDLICYNGHIGIYIGGGRIVHASNPRTGIIIGNADYRPIVAIRRIFN